MNSLLPANTGSKLAKLILFLLPFAYVFLYAPYGIENNDTGFILGYSWQVLTGATMYSDIIYVRPPASVYLHTIDFINIFGIYAPLFISRVIFYFQIMAYNLCLIWISKKYFKFENDTALYFSIAFCFIFCVHNFPPMAWHTVDGLFFSVIGLCFATCPKKDTSPVIYLGAAFLMAAALSKQSFYLIPIGALVFMLFNNQRRRALFSALAMTAVAAAFVVHLKATHSLDEYLSLTSGQTSLKDLFDAGIGSYWEKFKRLSLLTLLPPFIFLAALKRLSPKTNQKESLFLISVFWLILLCARKYLFSEGYAKPGYSIDVVFIVTGFACLYMGIIKKKTEYQMLLLLHLISWSASISWGYVTTMLFSSASIMTMAYALLKDSRLVSRSLYSGFILVFFSGCIVFYCGYRHPYNLERNTNRSEMNMDMGEIYPSLRFIKGDARSFAEYSEFKILHEKYGDNFTVLPSFNLAHALTKTRNPIGVDWVMNAEINNKAPEILHKLEHDGVVVFVFKNSIAKPETEGKFGSLVTTGVIQGWKKEGEYKFFDVYVDHKK